MSFNVKDLVIDKRIFNKISSTIKKYKSPMLLVGKSGMGKTLAINTIAKSLKYKVVNIDPDSNYKNNNKNMFIKRQVVLLDNLEEIKGKKLSELINHFIKDTRPFILVTSDVHRDLKNIKRKHNIRATNYTFSQSEWLDYLLNIYHKIPRSKIKKLIKYFRHNKAMVINQLSMELLETDIDVTKKLTEFEIRENIFNKEFNKKGLYFQDPFLSLSVFDNYVKLKKNNIQMCSNTSSALCIFDVMETKLKTKQDYSLSPYLDIIITQMATWDYNEILGFVGFPQYFIKMKIKPPEKRELLLETKLLKSNK